MRMADGSATTEYMETPLYQPPSSAPVLSSAVPPTVADTVLTNPEPSGHPAPPPQKRSRWWIWATVGVVVTGILGGGYWAYSHGYVSIPGLTPKADSLFTNMVQQMETIKNAKYGLEINIHTEDRPAGAKLTFATNTNIDTSNAAANVGGALGDILDTVNPNDLIKGIPTDASLRGSFTLQAEIDKAFKDADADFTVVGTYAGGDSSYALDVEMRKVGSTIYGILNRVPSLPYFDLSAVKGSWVAITPSDLGQSTEEMWNTADPRTATVQAKNVATTALNHKLLTVKKKLTDTTLEGNRVSRYQLALHADQLLPIYQELQSKAKSANANATTYDAVVQQLQDQSTKTLLQQLADASSVTVSIDKAKGYLRQLDWKITIVPPNDIEKLQHKQFILELVLNLSHVNDAVHVSAPGTSMTYDEAVRRVEGISLEQQQFQKQSERITEVQRAIAQYFKLKKTLPTKLDSLSSDISAAFKECETQAKATNQSQYTLCGYSSVAVDTTDVYTKKPFSYTVNGDDYQLKYQIHYYSGIPDYSKTEYIEGINTATKKMLSEEAKSTSYYFNSLQDDTSSTPASSTNTSSNTSSTISNTSTNASTNTSTNSWSALYPCLSGTPNTTNDSDHDGLSDYAEIYTYYTNPCATDSDNDGYPDKNEVDNRYNPNGPGKATDSQLRQWGVTSATTTTAGTGTWTSCISLDTQRSCASYCASISKTCSDTGTTSRNYPGYGGEAWISADACAAGSAGAGQVSCATPTDAGGARWKCYCQ